MGRGIKRGGIGGGAGKVSRETIVLHRRVADIIIATGSSDVHRNQRCEAVNGIPAAYDDGGAQFRVVSVELQREMTESDVVTLRINVLEDIKRRNPFEGLQLSLVRTNWPFVKGLRHGYILYRYGRSRQ
jgi:hypothetical protein